MKRKMFTRTLIFLLFILLSTPISAAPTPRNVQLKKNKKISITVLKNQKITLKAASKFNWSSSNKKIATVTRSGANGIVKPLKKGKVVIKATKGNTWYACQINVETPSLSHSVAVIDPGETIQLKVKGTTQKVKWATTNSRVASVTQNGLVTALSSGCARVYATITGAIYPCEVVVLNTVTPTPDPDPTPTPDPDPTPTPDPDPKPTPDPDPTPAPEPTPTPAPEKSKEVKYTITNTYLAHHVNSIGIHEFTAIATVRNDSDYGLWLKNCVFDVEDLSGHLVGNKRYSESCPDVIAPGATGYYFVSYGEIGEGNDNSQYRLKCYPEAELIKKAPQQCKSSDVSCKVNSSLGSINVIGRITNLSTETCDSVHVNILFFDSNESPLYIHRTYLSNLVPNVPMSFSSTIFEPWIVDSGKIKSYGVIAQGYFYQ